MMKLILKLERVIATAAAAGDGCMLCGATMTRWSSNGAHGEIGSRNSRSRSPPHPRSPQAPFSHRRAWTRTRLSTQGHSSSRWSSQSGSTIGRAIPRAHRTRSSGRTLLASGLRGPGAPSGGAVSRARARDAQGRTGRYSLTIIGWQSVSFVRQARVSRADPLLTRRDMTPAHKECLRSLPLVLHIPSEHVFVVHAGILPSDPHFPPSDMRQPLAHSPYLKSYPNDDFAHNVRSHLTDEVDEDRRVMFSLNELGRGQEVLYYPGRRNRTEERLRTAQEKAILSEIPDNRDPWVLLNMRGVRKKGKVTR